MRKSDLAGLRTKTPKELTKALSDKEKELAKIMAGLAARTEKNLKKGRNIRTDIAKIATIIREKEIMETLAKKEGERKE